MKKELIRTESKMLRKFGIEIGLLFIVIFGLFFPHLHHKSFPAWPYGLGGALISMALFVPQSLKWVHISWNKLAHTLGWVNSRIILSFSFLVIIVPTAFFLKIKGHDSLKLKKVNLVSYREPSKKNYKWEAIY